MNTQPSRSPVPVLVAGVVIPTVLWTALLGGLVLVVPGYQKTFADFNMALPAATVAVIAVAHWVANYWYVLLISLPFLLAPDVVIVLLLGQLRSRTPSRLWSGLMIALPLLAAALVVIAIYLPLAKLQEALSK